MRLTSTAFLCFLIAQPGLAAETPGPDKYAPLFPMDCTYAPGSIMESYINAYRAESIDTAIKRWEAFLKDNSTKTESASFEDLTDLILIRQAHYELMRLYYLKGRTAEADKLLKKATELVVYSAPEPGAAKRWCRTHRYCE